MTARIHERIRDILETTPGLTQRGLAERMGLNPAAVNRMLYGRRNIMAEEISVIEGYLGQKLDVHGPADEYRQPQRAAGRRGFSDVPQKFAPAEALSVLPPVPVLSGANVIDWVPRHPAQAGIADAFAIYVPSDDMAPRYFQGELVYVHPGRPPGVGRDCFLESAAGSFVRRLAALEDGCARVQQFNPARESRIELGGLKAFYSIVGRG